MKTPASIFLCRALWFALAVLGFSRLAAAQDTAASKPLRVAIRMDEPFAMKMPDGGYKGYAIDLWERIAGENGWKYDYIEFQSSAEILDAISQGRADVGAANITVTRSRLNEADFSLPFLDAGLQIMVDDRRKSGGSQFWKVISNPDHIEVAGYGSLIIVALALVVTLFERRLDPEFPKGWIEGWVESFYHVMSVIFTGKTNHKGIPGPFGRFFSAIWVATGVAVVALITSSITSSMTVNKLHGQINGPQDLPGKMVGTIRGSLGQTYCESLQLDTQLYGSLPDAVHALLKHEVNCIIYDAPVLQYYDNAHPELPISEVGPIINKAPYGFAFAQNSPLRTPFNRALFGLEEKGFVNTLHSQYFGSN
ncbi:MAG: transporter substrate-binding domain-containing protein [Verrucomicrobiota bacterium]